MPRAQIDITALKERALPHIEYLLEQAGWQTPLRNSCGEIRSACGKLSCNSETGLWCDHRDPDECSGDVIGLVAKQILGFPDSRGENFRRAIDWLTRFLGEEITDRTDRPKNYRHAPQVDQRRQAKKQARQSAQACFFRHVGPLRQPLDGGLGGSYLAQRGIDAQGASAMPYRPLDVFWVPGASELTSLLHAEYAAADAKPPLYLDRPWFGAILRLNTGKATSIQRVILDDHGTAVRLSCGRKAKYLAGSSKGAYLRLGESRAGPVAIVEGIEDALAICLITGIEVWAKAGSLAQVGAEDLPLGREVILAGDADRADNLPARNAFLRAVDKLSQRLSNVSVALPAPYGQKKRDWNDLLLSGHATSIADEIANRLPASVWLQENPRLPFEAAGGRVR